MANELRVYANLVGGLVENNPLTAAGTSLTSAGLTTAPAIGSTEHLIVVFDPDGLTGAPYAKRVTAHTAAASTATIEATAYFGTARDIPRDTPWVHTVVADDYGVAIGPGVIQTKTTTYTAANREIVLASASGGAWVLTLPAVGAGRWVTVKKTDSTANAITVTPASGTIDGASTHPISVQYTSRDFVSDGTNWFVV